MPLPAWPEGAFRGDSFVLSPLRCFGGLDKRVTERQGQPWLGHLCGVIVDKPPPTLGSVFSGEGAVAGLGQGARGGGAGMPPPNSQPLGGEQLLREMGFRGPLVQWPLLSWVSCLYLA